MYQRRFATIVGGVLAAALSMGIMGCGSSPSPASATPVPKPQNLTGLTFYRSTDITVLYPGTWKVVSTVSGFDNILLVRDPTTTTPLEPGLVVKKTRIDPVPIDNDIPSLLSVNQLAHPDLKVDRNAHISIVGAKEAVAVVSSFTQAGVKERILDLVVRTPKLAAYHLQAIGPSTVLTDSVIAVIIANFQVA